MANWSDLKAAVAEVIKTNGNQEITGQHLQNVLNSIISNVGGNSTFVDVATPTTNPGSPDGPVFYLASEAGTYSNFSGINVLNGEVVILKWNGTSWAKIKTGIAISEDINKGHLVLQKMDGKYYNYGSGALTENDTMFGTPIFAIKANTTYEIINLKDFGDVKTKIHYCLYDKLRNRLSSGTINKYFTTTENAIYCSITVYNQYSEEYPTVFDISEVEYETLPYVKKEDVGWWNYANGYFQLSETYTSSRKFLIEPNKEYILETDSTYSGFKVYICYYDKNQNRISNYNFSSNNTTVFTSPSNAVYATVTVQGVIDIEIFKLHKVLFDYDIIRDAGSADENNVFATQIQKIPTSFRKKGAVIKITSCGNYKILMYIGEDAALNVSMWTSLSNWRELETKEDSNIDLFALKAMDDRYLNWGNGMFTYGTNFTEFVRYGTNIFAVQPNTHYVLKNISTFKAINNCRVYVCYLDSNKARLSHLELDNTGIFITPDNTKYCGLTVNLPAETEITEKFFFIREAAGTSEMSSVLNGKHIWSMGDSHKTHYESYIALLSGALYNSTKNGNIRGVGQSKYAYMMNRNSMQAKYIVDDLYKQESEQIDYIFIEDVHVAFNGEIEKVQPYMCSVRYDYTDRTFESSTAALSYFKENISSILSGKEAKSDAALLMHVGTVSQSPRVQLSGTTSAGEVKIIFINSTGTRYESGISVEEGLNLQQALTKINQIQFSETGSKWENLNHHNDITTDYITFTYTGDITDNDADLKISYDFGTTGLSLVSENWDIESSLSDYNLVFMSRNVLEWTDNTKWIPYGDDYAFMKGAIEYLTANIPNVKIVLFSMQNISWDYESGTITEGNEKKSVLYEDGSFNYNALKATGMFKSSVNSREGFRKLAEYYNCQFIDVSNLCNMNMCNWANFYPSNNVHPNNAGYERIGEILARNTTV